MATASPTQEQQDQKKASDPYKDLSPEQKARVEKALAKAKAKETPEPSTEVDTPPEVVDAEPVDGEIVENPRTEPIRRSRAEKARLRKLATRYQVLETLASDDMEALRESVLANGILVHVIIDRDGNVIDGHHRVHLAVDNDLPIPFMVVDLQTDEEKRALAWELNRARRQMSAEQKAQIRWQKVVVEGLPIAQVAKELGESHDTTLRNVRKQAEADASSAAANGESPEPVEVLTPSERQRQTVIEALKATPEKSDRQIAKDTGASQPTVSRLRKKAAAATDPKKEVVKNKTAPKPTIHDDFAKAVAKLSKAADEVVRLSKDQRASRSSAKLWESHSQEMVAIMNGLKDLSLKLSGKTK